MPTRWSLRAGAEGSWHEPAQDDHDGRLELVQGRLDLGARLWRSSTAPAPGAVLHEILAGLDLRQTHLRGHGELPDGSIVPARLQAATASLAWRRLDGAGALLGLRLALGSASDRPFAASRNLGWQAQAVARIPGEHPHYAWLLGLDWNPDRHILPDWPLPFAAWQYVPGRHLVLNLGLPLTTVMWAPDPRLRMDLMLGVVNGASVDVGLTQAWRWRLAVRQRSEVWRRHEREDDDDRLLLRATHASAELRWQPAPPIHAGLQLGWAFDRSLSEGEDRRSQRKNRIELRPGPFAGMTVAMAF